MAVAADIPPVRITSADLRYAADARAGLATATFTPSPIVTDMSFVTITYADGVRENANTMNMVVMGGPSGWRMVIGTEINPDSRDRPRQRQAPHPRSPVGQAENQLPAAHRLEHDGPHGSVSAATYPQLTCYAIGPGA